MDDAFCMWKNPSSVRTIYSFFCLHTMPAYHAFTAFGKYWVCYMCILFFASIGDQWLFSCERLWAYMDIFLCAIFIFSVFCLWHRGDSLLVMVCILSGMGTLIYLYHVRSWIDCCLNHIPPCVIFECTDTKSSKFLAVSLLMFPYYGHSK